MSVRISLVNRSGSLTVQVEGRLQSADADLLKDQFATSAAALTLDLSGLLSADDDAIGVLVALEAAGADLTGASTYVRYLLARASSSDFGTGDGLLNSSLS